MPRYEFSDGRSHKFWEITVEGDGYTVHCGRIGTAGQNSAKQFKDAATAQKKADVVSTVHKMIWADGSLEPNKLVVARELLGADVSFKLTMPLLKKREAPPRVDRSLLTEDQRGLLLLAGVEIAKADGVVDPSEIEALHATGRALNLPDADERIAAALADPETVAPPWRG
jgi:tellurite resistance protein